MRLEHQPRITGLPPTTKTKSVRNNVLSQKLQIHDNQAANTVHSIRSSSIYYINSDVRDYTKFSGRNRRTVLEVLHTGSAGLFGNYDEYNYHDKRHVRARSTAFNNVTTHPEHDNWPRRTSHKLQITRKLDELPTSYNNKIFFNKQKRNQKQENKLLLENDNEEANCETNVANRSTWSLTNTDVLDNTAFNHYKHAEKNEIELFSTLCHKYKTTICSDSPNDKIIEKSKFEKSPKLSNSKISGKWTGSRDWRKPRRRRRRKNCLSNSFIMEHNSDNVSSNKYDNTACLEETTHERLSIQIDNHENYKINNKSFGRKYKRKSYGLFFLLYLLALPILCSTYPSPGIAASVSFVQKRSLVHADNATIRNLSTAAHLRSGGSHIDAQSHKEHLQGSEQVHPYNEYTWEVNQINPWLSACDMAGPAPADLQGSCGPPEVPKYCPIPCSQSVNVDRIFREIVESIIIPIEWRTGSSSNVKWKTNDKTVKGSTAPDQCLFYLEESHKRDICRDTFARSSSSSFSTSRENRYWFLSGLRLRHCCEHAVINALAPGKGGPLEDVLNGGRRCMDALDKILIVDKLAARLHCEFEEVLARYDCGQSYSVIHNCTHCKEAYRKWVCSSLVPYFAHEGPSNSLTSVGAYVGTRLRPCRSFCQSVEQRCPYLLPGDRAPAYPTQYAGEPTFLCRDPNIPETGEQAVRALHGDIEEECCFHVCSDDEPGSGICANCTASKPHGRRIGRDPPFAPLNCPTGHQNSLESDIELSSPSPSPTTSASSSSCPSSGSGQISSSATSNTALPPAPISLLCLLWIWAALISLCTGQMVFPWSPALDAGFVRNNSSWMTINSIKNTNKLTTKRKSSSIIMASFVRMAQRLHHVFFLRPIWALLLWSKESWWRWWFCVWKFTTNLTCRTFKWYHSNKRMKPREQDINYDNDNGRYFPRDKWRCCRHSRLTRKKARMRDGKTRRRKRRRFWFSPWKWKGPS